MLDCEKDAEGGVEKKFCQVEYNVILAIFKRELSQLVEQKNILLPLHSGFHVYVYTLTGYSGKSKTKEIPTAYRGRFRVIKSS